MESCYLSYLWFLCTSPDFALVPSLHPASNESSSGIVFTPVQFTRLGIWLSDFDSTNSIVNRSNFILKEAKCVVFEEVPKGHLFQILR